MIGTEEGFEIERGFPFSAGNGVTEIAVTTRRPVLSIRPKATFNSIVNRGRIDPESVAINVGSGTVLVEIVYGGALTGASFGSAAATSIVEFDVAATAITGGTTTYARHAGSTSGTIRGNEISNLLSRLPLTLNAAGTNPIPLSVVATAFTGSVDVAAQLNWREMR